jgi:hypothetical protein
MKILPQLLVATVLSCSNPYINPINTNEITTKPPAAFNCNYEQQKEACKKIMGLTDAEKRSRLIKTICDSMIPCWYGTPWNFYGTSETPGKGTIACGYFVTTIVRDAGLTNQRIKLAQVASEEMIKTLCEKSTIERFSNKSIDEFVLAIKKMGTGLYITGLDNHTGFIYNDSLEVYFIHASYITPKCVVKEFAVSSAILSSSRYRVIGKVKL